MTTANPQQRQFTLFHKSSIEVRPPEKMERDDRFRLMTCLFEEIAESEEEDIQLPERTSLDGRSPFAVACESPFAERLRSSHRSLSPTFARKFLTSHLCRGFSDSCLRRQAPTMFGSLSPERHDSVSFSNDHREPTTATTYVVPQVQHRKIAESEEEEDVQLPERTSLDGRSPFAVAFDSPFAERRGTSSRNLSPIFARKFAVPQLCRGFSDSCLHRRQTSTMLGSLSPGRHAGSDLLTLPSIPETASM